MQDRSLLVGELTDVVGVADVVTDGNEIGRRLRDNSWLSPVLSEHISMMADTEGTAMNVSALVMPADVNQLTQCVSRCYLHDSPITMLGAGTTNFGQTIPLDGGIVISTRHLKNVSPPEAGRVTAEAGATAGRVDTIARTTGQQVPVMTTTYVTATAAGWVCGATSASAAPHGDRSGTTTFSVAPC